MTQVNSNISYTGLVEKYIGTAYDTVKRVADNMTAIDNINTAITDGSFDALVAVSDQLAEVDDKLNNFDDTYLGKFANDTAVQAFVDNPENPETIAPGDLYYNTTNDHMYVYVGYAPNEGWQPLGTIQKSTEFFTITQGQVDSDVITLSTPYIEGQDNIIVFLDGIFIPSNSTAGVTTGYTETNPETLTFDDGILTLGAELVVSIGTEVSNVKHTVLIDTARYLTAIPNEQVITLPNDLTYVIGDGNMEVYLDRRLQLPGIEYVETSPTKITFNLPLQLNQEIYFKIGNVLADNDGVEQVLMQDTVPETTDYGTGQLWFNTRTARTYILYVDTDTRQWVSITNEDEVLDPDSTGVMPSPENVITTQNIIMQDAQPATNNLPQGTMWYKTNTGDMHILVYDGDSAQWIMFSR